MISASFGELLRHVISTVGRNPSDVTFTHPVAGKSESRLEFYPANALLIDIP
jgi:hypothetical protein